MREFSEVHDASARRRMDQLLRSVMMSLFVAGAVAIGVLWAFEAKFDLLDKFSSFAYPTMLATFIACTAMLYRWPESVAIARWAGFCAISGFLVMELIASLSVDDVPLVGNYAFISLLMWLPLAYAIALFMLETRQAPWAACALFTFIAILSLAHIIHSRSPGPSDTLLLINLLASHLVLLACLSGLVKVKSVLFKADVRSRHLFEQASTDPLTGLANRRYGLDMLRVAALEHAAETPSAVMLCDIDHFKRINDRYGHDVGDKVVITLATVLQKSTRGVDTVVRWGGDEFLIVVPQIGMTALAELAERLRTRVAEALVLDDEKGIISPTLSIGVAEMTEGESLGGWIKRADEALYQAKAGGRDRYVFAGRIEAGDLPTAASPASELALDCD